MKKSILLLNLLLAAFIASAQLIDGAEYFWDTDPGIGLGLPLTIAEPGETVTGDFQFDSNGLKEGPHKIGIRFHKDDGTWGIPRYRRIVVHQFTGAEYFWNTDPGLGNGNFLALNSTSTDYEFDMNVNTTTLAPGTHKLFIRTSIAIYSNMFF